ncbi:GNAT family N-acetyltransferase [Croceicoccus sp. YJ47]|uniref:GNAT family N-acetyltransferase n=1 Tax=Croceicoccus sp. YJ47 TaxID=2798724 RepID=UPI001923D854|nr:GNAT family N-acetyltransferase [Croceicoccus sp. YJ47]QQN73008.1 GNAT family N-acetyltransferase [Croceicoccus sp. YJ47]
MPAARLARMDDLPALLALFAACEVSPAARPPARAAAIWQETMDSPFAHVFVAVAGQEIAATSMLVTAPNILREGRSHAFLENVMTHPAWRGRGLGRSVVAAALAHAWTLDCHQVLLQSGRADPRIHRFYESAGFRPGLRTAYAAMRPIAGAAPGSA